MSNAAVVARLVSKPETNAEVEEVLRGLVEATRSEEGTLLYVMNQDVADPNIFWFYELYADDAAFAAHAGSAAMAAAFTKLADALAEAPALHMVKPVVAKAVEIA